jgi:hypothetical protein
VHFYTGAPEGKKVDESVPRALVLPHDWIPPKACRELTARPKLSGIIAVPNHIEALSVSSSATMITLAMRAR